MLPRCFCGILVATGLACGLSAHAAKNTSHSAELSALIRSYAKADGPGVAVLVSRDAVPLHLGGYGMADVDARKPITADSIFDLASVSKHFTGVAILTLVESGELREEADVVEYLPDYAVPVKGRPVTVADLLHHISGLADYCGDEWDRDDDEFAALTPESHLEWLNTTKPRRAPGVAYEYNNTEYALLALIVERVSGETFADYLQEHLFEPAGLQDTFVLDGNARLPAKTVKGYVTNKDGKLERAMQPTIMTGDGNIYSSVRDLARWDAALREHKIISAASQQQAWSTGRLDDGNPIKDADGNGYGYGWVVEKPGELVSHTGAWDGTSTFLSMNLRTGLTVAVLSNDETTDSEALADAIAELFEDE